MSAPLNLGAWRDRTNLFISYRQSYTHHPAPKRTHSHTGSSRFSSHVDADSERAGLMGDMDDGDAVIEMDVLPPRWLDVQDEITATLAAVAGKMKKLDQLHAKHVLPGFDDESVKAREEREIEALSQEITRAFSACQRAIKRIDTMLHEQGAQRSNADETMARNLQISLASRVGEVSTLFRKKQAAYLKKLRSLGGMASPLNGASTPVPGSSAGGGPVWQNPYTDPAMQDELADRSSAQHTLQQTAQVRKRVGIQDSAIAQREAEIEKIAQGVIDLSTIFQELNAMVIDQGSLLDRIDYNVERTAEHTKEAEKELVVATKYQKKSTKRKIILLLVLLVVGMFILLLVKPRSRGGAADASPPTPQQGPGRRMWVGGVEGRIGRVEGERRMEWKRRRRRKGGSSVLS